MAGITFGRFAAAVPVSDIGRALAFYQDILGMSVAFINGDPTGFVILRRDAAELHLTLVRGHRAGLHNVARLMVTDATALHDHLVASGARIVKGLRDADNGLRGFVMADPDGNRIDIGQRLLRQHGLRAIARSGPLAAAGDVPGDAPQSHRAAGRSARAGAVRAARARSAGAPGPSPAPLIAGGEPGRWPGRSP